MVSTCEGLLSKNTVYRKKKQGFENTSLSANMVAKYGNDLAGAIQCQLKEKCIYFVAY